jgi:hypothetical protein
MPGISTGILIEESKSIRQLSTSSIMAEEAEGGPSRKRRCIEKLSRPDAVMDTEIRTDIHRYLNFDVGMSVEVDVCD